MFFVVKTRGGLSYNPIVLIRQLPNVSDFVDQFNTTLQAEGLYAFNSGIGGLLILSQLRDRWSFVHYYSSSVRLSIGSL